jgi:hypothetical protein
VLAIELFKRIGIPPARHRAASSRSAVPHVCVISGKAWDWRCFGGMFLVCPTK